MKYKTPSHIPYKWEWLEYEFIQNSSERSLHIWHTGKGNHRCIDNKFYDEKIIFKL